MTIYLVNPDKRGENMARSSKRRPRDKNGRFLSKASAKRRRTRRRSTRRRSNPTSKRRTTTVARKRTTRRRAPARRRTTTARRRTYRRRNPDVVKMLTSGVQGAAFIVAGEAAARGIPAAVGLPTAGAAGMASRVAVAVAAGMAADKFVGRDAGARVLEGGLASVLRDVVATAGIPGVSNALSSYSRAAALPPVSSRRIPTNRVGMGLYANVPGLNGYADANGVGCW